MLCDVEADALLAKPFPRPLAGVTISGDASDAVAPERPGKFLDDLDRAERRPHLADEIEHHLAV
jgi:hypothetical protein